MPQRLIGQDCWIFLKRLQDRSGEYRTYMICQTKQRGLVCPRDRKGGKKPYEIGASCFEAVGVDEFLTEVVYPGLMEPRTSTPQDATVGDLLVQQVTEEAEAKKEREKRLKGAVTHVH